MTSTLTRPAPGSVEAPGSARDRRPRSRVVLRGLLTAVVLAAVAALAVGLRGDAPPPEVVATGVVPVFAEDVRSMQSDWGSAEVFGVDGSTIVAYEHDTDIAMRVAWDGGRVEAARLGDEEIHLLTVTGLEQDADGLILTLHRDNCRYFHERAIDMFPHVTLDLADGSSVWAVFERPLFVKSPMLASCPDRTLDRQDHTRRG